MRRILVEGDEFGLLEKLASLQHSLERGVWRGHRLPTQAVGVCSTFAFERLPTPGERGRLESIRT